MFCDMLVLGDAPAYKDFGGHRGLVRAIIYVTDYNIFPVFFRVSLVVQPKFGHS